MDMRARIRESVYMNVQCQNCENQQKEGEIGCSLLHSEIEQVIAKNVNDVGTRRPLHFPDKDECAHTASKAYTERRSGEH